MAITKKTTKKSAKAAKKPKAAAKKPSSKKTAKAPATKKKTAITVKKKSEKNATAKKAVKVIVKKKPAVKEKVTQPKPIEQSIPQPPAQPQEESQTPQETKKGMDKYSIDVLEGPDNRYFVLTINSYRNFFALEEMRHIVKACHQSAGEQEGMQRLYHWFKNFRQDVIINTKIEGPSDPALATIYNYIVSTYTVKGS